MIVISTEGLLFFLALKIESLDDMWIRLYQNDDPVNRLNDITDFEEADFPGYAPQQFFAWTTPVLNGDDDAETTDLAKVFVATGDTPANDIYGYYVTDELATVVYFWERNAAAPVVIDEAGKTYSVLPKFIEGIFAP